MKSLTEVLVAGGLIRPVRPRGFCPACKGWFAGTGDPTQRARREVDPAALATLVVLVVAALAWILTIAQSGSTLAPEAPSPAVRPAPAGLRGGAAGSAGVAAMDRAMGLGSLQSFATTWLVMMAAMMLPTALPLVYEFAHNAEGRRGWPVATAALAVAYLAVWLVFGLLCYAVYRALNMPWPNQRLIGGLALVLAALYALTPIKRASEALCRELCALHDPLPFSLQRSAWVAGVRYGLSCLGCTAGLMVAAVIIGMTSLGWMVIISGLILVYKLAPPLEGKYKLLVSLAIAVLGIVYMIVA
jgi:predicted metal-binding membrane protein